MTLVIDASVAVKWFVQENDSGAALAVAARDISRIAPDLIVAEVMNVFRKKLRSGEIASGQARNAVTILPRFFDELVASAGLADAAFDLSVRLDHSPYDCLYLACALQRDRTLVTCDDVFRREAEAGGFARYVRALKNAQGWATA